MHIDISSRFNYKSLFRFVLLSIVMMIFISTYTMVDGYFVSNYVGKTAFTAVNLIFPAIMVFACVGFMFGSGGSALVAKTMGEGQMEKANRLFSLIVLSALAGGILLSALGYFLMPFLAAAMGASGEVLACSVFYGRTLLLSLPMFPAGIPIVHGHRRKTFSRSPYDDPLRCNEYRARHPFHSCF